MLFEQLKQDLKIMVDDHRLSGATIGLLNIKTQQRQVSALGTLGQGEYAKTSLTTDYYYDLASLTKLYTTYRLIQLKETNKLALADSVQHYLPEFSYPDITIKHLLLHNSGLAKSVRKMAPLTKAVLEEDIIHPKRLLDVEKETLYSDVGFMLLGQIIMAVTQTPLAEDYTHHLLAPYGLKQTHFRLNDMRDNQENYVPTEDIISRGGMLQGQVDDYKAYLLGGAAGHAGIFATIDDTLGFLKIWLDRDVKFWQDMQDNQFGIRTLGWHYWTFGGEDHPISCQNWLYQTGFTGTIMALDLTTGRGLVILTNRVHPNRQNNQSWLVERYELLQRFFVGG